ncbi:phosphatidylinositol-specific phospholipase C [Flavobacterium hercynium]|uniref:1-phosphatidylinositol phosphodiesterase n=1 Tax=Flavobacterium hercynium TaxID=387094 RepID=A0A226HKM0_9FLAO|nr:phosphatidylinositol-specific phospholipase C [Flavobacterium hercynium]OXA94889.1 hypothetical protein B0A66_03980 [Flavobacterium hercynium]SMP09155.1 1-phosphatidylinositol phosphodiesterase [Flavobacterium hercynium]
MKKTVQNLAGRCWNLIGQSKGMKSLMIIALSISMVSCSNDEVESVNTSVEKPKEEVPAEEKSNTGKKFTNYYSLKKWMERIPNYTDITKMTIPGTHNSGALFDYKAGPIGLQNAGKTQNYNITAQLNMGVRFLDIRCKIVKNKLVIYHGIADQKQTLYDVLTVVEKFLSENPSEFIFLSIKKEDDKDSLAEFQRLLRSYFSNNKFWDRVYKNNNGFPYLKDVRGKIVLIKRFGGFDEAGYSAAYGWMDDSENFIIRNNNYSFNVQDAYIVTYTDDKVNNSKKQMARAGNSTNKNELFLNFYSGYKKMFGRIPNVRSVSTYVNPKLNSYVAKTKSPQSGFGVCILDFIDESLSKTIVNKNIFQGDPVDFVECDEF